MDTEEDIEDEAPPLKETIVKAAKDHQETIHIDGTVDLEEMDYIFDNIDVDNPDLYWVHGYHLCSVGNKTDITFKIINDYSMDEIISMTNELDAVIASLADEASVFETDYEKALYVHDAIVNSTEYDSENAAQYDGVSPCGIWGTPYGALIQHKSVCQGYAEAYKLVMDKLGIECGLITGTCLDLGEDHAWNYIKLDDNYYWVDLTWDDPTYNGEKGFLSHSYFLFDDDLLYASRTIDEYFTSVPECSSMDMNYFVHNGCYFDHYDFDELEEASLRMATEKSVEFMFSDRETLEEAYNALIDGKDVWRLSAFLSYHTVNPFVVEDMNVLSLVFKNG